MAVAETVATVEADFVFLSSEIVEIVDSVADRGIVRHWRYRTNSALNNDVLLFDV